MVHRGSVAVAMLTQLCARTRLARAESVALACHATAVLLFATTPTHFPMSTWRTVLVLGCAVLLLLHVCPSCDGLAATVSSTFHQAGTQHALCQRRGTASQATHPRRMAATSWCPYISIYIVRPYSVW